MEASYNLNPCSSFILETHMSRSNDIGIMPGPVVGSGATLTVREFLLLSSPCVGKREGRATLSLWYDTGQDGRGSGARGLTAEIPREADRDF